MSSQVLRVGRFSTGTVDIHPQHAYRGRFASLAARLLDTASTAETGR